MKLCSAGRVDTTLASARIWKASPRTRPRSATNSRCSRLTSPACFRTTYIETEVGSGLNLTAISAAQSRFRFSQSRHAFDNAPATTTHSLTRRSAARTTRNALIHSASRPCSVSTPAGSSADNLTESPPHPVISDAGPVGFAADTADSTPTFAAASRVTALSLVGISLSINTCPPQVKHFVSENANTKHPDPQSYKQSPCHWRVTGYS